MKLSDIIDFELSYWNVLGQSGGTALPDNDNPVNEKGINIWKKSPPYRVGSGTNQTRIDEVGGGGRGGQQQSTAHYDIASDPDIDKIGDPKYRPDTDPEYDNWATPPKDGKSRIVPGPRGTRRKIMTRKTGKNSAETMDDEGNHYLVSPSDSTGRISHKRMHTGKDNRSAGSDVDGGSNIYETTADVGQGYGGMGAVQHPKPGTAELEYDLDRVWDEFKGVDTRAEIKTNKKKRKTLKQYLSKRTDREVD